MKTRFASSTRFKFTENFNMLLLTVKFVHVKIIIKGYYLPSMAKLFKYFFFDIAIHKNYFFDNMLFFFVFSS